MSKAVSEKIIVILKNMLMVALQDVEGCFDLRSSRSSLNGWFSAEELRRIATAMDLLKVQEEEKEE